MAGRIVTQGGRQGAALIGVLAWGVLTFGAVYPWAYWPLFVAAAIVGLSGIAGDRALGDPRLKTLSMALAVLAMAMAVQTIALPSWLIVELSPGVDRFLRDFRIGYHPAELRTLSLDPEATRVVLSELVAFSLLLVGVTRLLRRWPLDWIVNQLMALAVAVAVVGILQKALLDPDRMLIYGFWRPRQGGGSFGPFVNRNHFAGWMLMLLPLVAGYGWALVQRAERRDGHGPRDWLRWVSGVDGNRVLLVWTCVLVMAVSLVMTESRSGMVAAAAGMCVLLVFLWRSVGGRARLVVTGLVVTVLVAAFLWSGASVSIARFNRAPDDLQGRMSAWRDTLQIVSDFPLAGTGFGGYRQAMLLYQTRDREAFYAQAHNDYLQVVAEGGALVALPAAVVLLLMVAGIRRRLQSSADTVLTYWIRRGAVAGLVGVAAQSVVEFSLQIPGNAAMCVALAAVALHRPRSYTDAYRV